MHRQAHLLLNAHPRQALPQVNPFLFPSDVPLSAGNILFATFMMRKGGKLFCEFLIFFQYFLKIYKADNIRKIACLTGDIGKYVQIWRKNPKILIKAHKKSRNDPHSGFLR